MADDRVNRGSPLNTPRVAGPAEGFLRDVMTLEGPPTPEDEQRFAERYKIFLGRPGE